MHKQRSAEAAEATQRRLETSEREVERQRLMEQQLEVQLYAVQTALLSAAGQHKALLLEKRDLLTQAIFPPLIFLAHRGLSQPIPALPSVPLSGWLCCAVPAVRAAACRAHPAPPRRARHLCTARGAEFAGQE